MLDRIEIVRTDQDQRGHSDLRKPIECWWIELLLLDVTPVGGDLERPPLHPSNQVTNRRVHRLRIPPYAIDPTGHIRFYRPGQIASRQGSLFGIDERP